MITTNFNNEPAEAVDYLELKEHLQAICFSLEEEEKELRSQYHDLYDGTVTSAVYELSSKSTLCYGWSKKIKEAIEALGELANKRQEYLRIEEISKNYTL